MTLSVVCWLWEFKYSEQHVNVLYRAVKEHLKMPFNFYCITDRANWPKQKVYLGGYAFDKGINLIPIWEDFGNFGLQYRRLQLHSEEMKEIFGERILQIDLEMMFLKDFTHLITNESFKIWKHPSTCQRGWMYNTSLMLTDTGKYNNVWHNYKTNPKRERSLKDKNKWLGTDQAILSNYIHPAPTWTENDGVYSYKMHIERAGLTSPPEDAVVVGLYGNQYDPIKLLHVDWIKAYWDKYTTSS